MPIVQRLTNPDTQYTHTQFSTKMGSYHRYHALSMAWRLGKKGILFFLLDMSKYLSY